MHNGIALPRHAPAIDVSLHMISRRPGGEATDNRTSPAATNANGQRNLLNFGCRELACHGVVDVVATAVPLMPTR